MCCHSNDTYFPNQGPRGKSGDVGPRGILGAPVSGNIIITFFLFDFQTKYQLKHSIFRVILGKEGP